MGGIMISKNFRELENRVRATMNKDSAYNYGRFYNMSAEDLLTLLSMEEK